MISRLTRLFEKKESVEPTPPQPEPTEAILNISPHSLVEVCRMVTQYRSHIIDMQTISLPPIPPLEPFIFDLSSWIKDNFWILERDTDLQDSSSLHLLVKTAASHNIQLNNIREKLSENSLYTLFLTFLYNQEDIIEYLESFLADKSLNYLINFLDRAPSDISDVYTQHLKLHSKKVLDDDIYEFLNVSPAVKTPPNTIAAVCRTCVDYNIQPSNFNVEAIIDTALKIYTSKSLNVSLPEALLTTSHLFEIPSSAFKSDNITLEILNHWVSHAIIIKPLNALPKNPFNIPRIEPQTQLYNNLLKLFSIYKDDFLAVDISLIIDDLVPKIFERIEQQARELPVTLINLYTIAKISKELRIITKTFSTSDDCPTNLQNYVLENINSISGSANEKIVILQYFDVDAAEIFCFKHHPAQEEAILDESHETGEEIIGTEPVANEIPEEIIYNNEIHEVAVHENETRENIAPEEIAYSEIAHEETNDQQLESVENMAQEPANEEIPETNENLEDTKQAQEDATDPEITPQETVEEVHEPAQDPDYEINDNELHAEMESVETQDIAQNEDTTQETCEAIEDAQNYQQVPTEVGGQELVAESTGETNEDDHPEEIERENSQNDADVEEVVPEETSDDHTDQSNEGKENHQPDDAVSQPVSAEVATNPKNIPRRQNQSKKRHPQHARHRR